MKKEYYPISFFDITCEADWSATSYWEHEESYQVAREETVYIDYKGREHKHNDYDIEHINGNSYKRYRRPMTRTVWDTRYRTVTDNVQQTKGVVVPHVFHEKVWLGPSSPYSDTFFEWIDRFDKYSFKPANSEYLKDYDVISESVSFDNAMKTADRNARKDIGDIAENDVPGTRFEDLLISSLITRREMVTKYIGVYNIKYSYGRKKYECIISGSDNSQDYIFKEGPVDTTIERRLLQMDKDIKSIGFRRIFYVLGAIVAPIGGIILFLLLWYLMASNRNAFSVAFWISFIVSTVFFIGFIIVNIIAGTRIASIKERKENFNSDNAELKKKILALIKDDSISEESKAATISKWVGEQPPVLSDEEAEMYDL